MIYKYRGIKDDKMVSGKIESESVNEVINYLKNQQMFLIEVASTKKEESPSFFSSLFNRVSFTTIVDFTRQLSIMLTAGLSLIDSFDILKKQTKNSSLLKILNDIDKEIKGGRPLSYALAKYPQNFSGLYIALVRSGEASGKLSEILLKLADNLEAQREFQGKIKGALIYPTIIVIAMLLVMFVMVTFVLPQMLGLFKDFDVELPVTTQFLMSISSFSSHYWPIIILVVAGVVIVCSNFLRTNAGKLFSDKLKFKIPVINNIVIMSNLVDSTRTLAILIGAGVSILEGLNIIVDTSSNLIFRKAFENVYKEVEKGVSLGNAMAEQGVFPPILIQMAIVGEQTGHLDETFMRIANYFEMESSMAVKAMTVMIEPLILIFLGVAVGFLVMSIITPMYSLTSSFK